MKIMRTRGVFWGYPAQRLDVEDVNRWLVAFGALEDAIG